MNYRHAFHAGNFADVVKHVLLTLALVHLRKKETPFRVIDTHAGTGRTNLESAEATRGGEWQAGVGRIWKADLGPAVEPLLAELQLAAPVAQGLRVTLLRAEVGGGHGGQRLILAQHGGQGSAGLRQLQPGGGVGVQQPAAGGPGGERLDRRGTPRQGRARRTGCGLRGQPRAQDRQVQPAQTGAGGPLVEECEQRPQVGQVGATGVFGPAALQREMLGVLTEDLRVGIGPVHSPTVADAAAAERLRPMRVAMCRSRRRDPVQYSG